ASTLDSYSCVVIVSETMLMSMPTNGLAALMNHCISFICSSLLSVEGWNSLSIQRLAAASSAYAGVPIAPKNAVIAMALAIVDRRTLALLSLIASSMWSSWTDGRLHRLSVDLVGLKPRERRSRQRPTKWR